MTHICSVGLGIPKYSLTQHDIKSLVAEVYSTNKEEVMRLLPVFDHACIKERQFVVDQDWFKTDHSFADRNDLYIDLGEKYTLKAIDDCLTNEHYLAETIPYEAIDMIIFISSTGIATPTLDVHLLNARPFREEIKRMPLWGLGCAGGAIGLSRANDYLVAYPDQNVLVVCVEFCSLTFQRHSFEKSHVVGTALFGDGVAAVLLLGSQSPYLSHCHPSTPIITASHSLTKKQSTEFMGWGITNRGFEVIFSKEIPNLVHTFWKEHVMSFLASLNMTTDEIDTFIAHPGGRKVLEAMEETLTIKRSTLNQSYDVLRAHGNMSSATVYYVLNQYMHVGPPPKQTKNILCALGPGFSSELLLIEWG